MWLDFLIAAVSITYCMGSSSYLKFEVTIAPKIYFEFLCLWKIRRVMGAGSITACGMCIYFKRVSGNKFKDPG